MKRLYFGHPVNTYGTLLEEILLQQIRHRFPDWEIENPNQPRHQAGYDRFKREHGSGMKYYYEEVLPACHGGVFLPFRDGAWGAGVFGEAEFLAKQGSSVWEIVLTGNDGAGDFRRIGEVADLRVLSVDETRARIRDADGNRLPF